MTRSLPEAEVPFSNPELPQPRLGNRELFPKLKAPIYLAHAAISPANSALERACAACINTVAEEGVASFPVWSAQRERLRGGLAQLMGVPTDSIALTQGCTRGISDLALALPWRRGDILLTFEGEFPANVTPWQIAARAHGGQVRFLPLPKETSSDFAEKTVLALKEVLDTNSEQGTKIRWVAVSAVQFQTGVRMPLAALTTLCRSRGVRLLVDGIQACGVVPLNLVELGVDAFFSGAHKWLLGLEGVGFSYISPELMGQLTPMTAGWLSHEDGDHFLFSGAGYLRRDRPFKKGPRVFEGSTTNNLGFVALEVGVELCRKLSPEAIYHHVQAYHDVVEGPFEQRGFVSLRPKEESSRSCILSFSVPAGIRLQALTGALKERGVTVSIPDGLLRLSPHFSNNVTEVPLLLDALDEALVAAREAS